MSTGLLQHSQGRTCPPHLVLLGAGASYGSDRSGIVLPPLAKDLFADLEASPIAPSWRTLPQHIRTAFRSEGFEGAMARIFADDALLATQLPRDWELAHYFSAFVPSGRSLYMQLASRLAIATSRGWNGALVTLNYERLLEVALLRNCLFPVVEGVDFYDDHLPALTPQQCIEITYPHGACHFFLGSKPFTLVNGGGVLMNGRFVGGGVNQLLVQKHISEAIAQQYLPLICRIEPGKRPSVSHEFFDIQRNRTRELILAARLIVIIGVSCRHEVDRHLWQPLAATSARLVYVEPIEAAANKFRSWAKGQGRAEPDGFEVAGFDFANGFDRICSELGI